MRHAMRHANRYLLDGHNLHHHSVPIRQHRFALLLCSQSPFQIEC